MNATAYGTDALIRAARAAAEAFLATLNEATGYLPAPGQAGDDGPLAFDPLHDEPPFDPDPNGTEAQKQLAYITYLGSIGRLNAEEGRGAQPKEISEFARKAGYSGGNAVNGWNSRPNSPRAVEMVNGARFMNSEALKWITKEASKLGIKLVGEIATVPAPQ